MWLPVLATYLIGWRKRTVTLHVSDGVVVRGREFLASVTPRG
jgi:hypothetical protein